MDELRRYIITYYAYLMTDKEAKAQRTLITREKISRIEGTLLAEKMRERWMSNDPEVLAIIANGETQFYDLLCARILREHSHEIFFNHCPQCNALARTPKAKQCPSCFHSWHDNE